MKYIDLRSDTVTVPLTEMRELMMTAEVGDDVYEDDYTVKRLEKTAADMVGKQAGLFVPSGTFGNQLAILTHTKRGDEIIVGSDAHILMHEVGAAAVISNVQLRNTKIKDDESDVKRIKSLIRTENIHHPDTGLICLENARSNGTVLSVESIEKISELAKNHNIPVHLDGARYFNASIALGIDYRKMASYVDSVNICLSKGLCAPIGSVLVGSEEFIKRARKNRKMMGGGLRQVGIIAAPGIYALKNLVDRLKEDHENAKYLADKLDDMPEISVDKSRLDINMVFFKLKNTKIKGQDFVNALKDFKIKINGPRDNEYRFATHYYIKRKDIDYVIKSIKGILQS